MSDSYFDVHVSVGWTQCSAALNELYHSILTSFGNPHLSCDARKPISGFPTRPDTNRPVQLQKRARCLKFWIYKVEELQLQRS